jgi:capsular polysaccharide export protein
VILLTPPFPGPSPDQIAVSRTMSESPRTGPHDTPLTADRRERIGHILDKLRHERVGGSFWGARVSPQTKIDVWVRPRSLRECASVLETLPGRTLLMSLPRANWARGAARRLARKGVATTIGAVDPWAMLDLCGEVAVAGDDEVAFLALVAGCRVNCFADGAVAGWGLTVDHPDVPRKGDVPLEALAAHLLLDCARYHDPFQGTATTPEQAIDLLAFWRGEIERNRAVAAAAGIAFWKKEEVGRMLWAGQPTLPPLTSFGWRRPLRAATRGKGGVAVWPSRMPRGLAAAADRAQIPLYQVEDGFIRSVGLGSDCVPPLSVIVDRQGIYYDASRPSDLESLIELTEYSPELIGRAQKMIQRMVEGGIGKYQTRRERVMITNDGKRCVLVVGQVEDDLSVVRSGAGVTGNLDLLRRARAAEPDAYILFRPHPDVEAGHRAGGIDDREALRYADRVMRSGSMAGLIEAVDAVHVLTSLAGFEALLRGKDVVAHGQPFYAGWGLTRDLAPPVPRRRRRVSLAELVGAAIILYPRYLDPVTRMPCPPEILIDRFASAYRPRMTWVTRLRMLQTRFRGLAPRASIAR